MARARRLPWSVSLVVACGGLTAGIQSASANPMTPGDILVYRVGDGSTALSSGAAPVFIDEYSPTGVLQPGSIALPTADSGSTHALTSSGSAVEGLMNFSADDRYLMLSGYDATVGTATVATSSVSRVVGRIDLSGNIDTSTALTDASIGNNIRGIASSDGTNIWVSGASTGVRYTTLGSTTSMSVIGSGTRGVSIFGGQLYAGSTNSPAFPTIVSEIGANLPTSTAAAIALNGLPAPDNSVNFSTNQFLFLHLGPTGNSTDPDTLYVADDKGTALSKYSLVVVSGVPTWVANGQVGSGGDDYTGLSAIQSGSTVTLYATLQEGSSKDELASIVDTSGYNGSLTGTAVNVLSTASNKNNFAYLGVAVIPAPEPASIGLIALGAGAGLLRRRKRHA